MARADIESIEKHLTPLYRQAGFSSEPNRKNLFAALVMDGKGLMKLEIGQEEKGLLRAKVARNAAKWKANREQRSLQNERHISSSAALNSSYRL